LLKFSGLLGMAFVLAVSARAEPSCNTQAGMSAVDISQPVTTISTVSGKSGVEAFKTIGVKTIARYYDWADGDITCKSLLPNESDVILGAGLNILSIFQHENSDPETFFNASRGTKDAKEALKIAAANGQPGGSAIYFAVDGVDQTIKDSVFEYLVNKGKSMSAARRGRLLKADPSFRKHIKFYARFLSYHHNIFHKSAPDIHAGDMIPFVDRYFKSLNSVLKADGRYKIGGYGSGMVCQHLLGRHLVDYCWLAMSTGWPGSKEFHASGRWSLVQQRSTFCKNWKFKGRETVRFDFNKVKGGNYGQWSKKGPVTPASSLPATCKPSW
jgi:Domain of unknown function (DUF1906)